MAKRKIQIESVKMTADVECIMLNAYTVTRIMRTCMQVANAMTTVNYIDSPELEDVYDALTGTLTLLNEVVEAFEDQDEETRMINRKMARLQRKLDEAAEDSHEAEGE